MDRLLIPLEVSWIVLWMNGGGQLGNCWGRTKVNDVVCWVDVGADETITMDLR